MLKVQYSKSTLIQTQGATFLTSVTFNEKQFLGYSQSTVNYLHEFAKFTFHISTRFLFIPMALLINVKCNTLWVIVSVCVLPWEWTFCSFSSTQTLTEITTGGMLLLNAPYLIMQFAKDFQSFT
jgi:hypothetical protein